ENRNVVTSLTAPSSGSYYLHARLFTDDGCTSSTGGVKDFGPFTVTSAVPNLTISKVATDQNSGGNADLDPDFYYGVEGRYTLTVTNSGTGATSGTITVEDVLPSSLTYSCFTGSGWSCSATGQTV